MNLLDNRSVLWRVEAESCE